MIKIKINKELGGNLTSINFNGIEMLHQPDKDSWMGQDVDIFPFTARLKDGKYLVEGKEYSMKNHGLIRYLKPTVLFDDSDYKVVTYTYSEDTLKQYPYKFRFTTIYQVRNNTVKITSKVENLDNKTMYFGLGWHPAIQIPHCVKDDKYCIDGSYIDFGKETRFNRYFTDEKGNYITRLGFYKKMKRMNLSKNKFINNNSYILTTDDMDRLTLVRKDGIEVSYDFDKAPILTIWTMEKSGDYICIEPWYGIPDYDKPVLEMKDKPLINSLSAGKSISYSYSMTFKA